jgi:hypothetical protein
MIVRVANARRLVRSIPLSLIDERHRNYNLADFSLQWNSFTDKVYAATQKGKIRSKYIYCGPESKLRHKLKFAAAKLQIFEIRKIVYRELSRVESPLF